MVHHKWYNDNTQFYKGISNSCITMLEDQNTTSKFVEITKRELNYISKIFIKVELLTYLMHSQITH